MIDILGADVERSAKPRRSAGKPDMAPMGFWKLQGILSLDEDPPLPLGDSMQKLQATIDTS